MTTTIQKWGNSLAIRLPKMLAGEAHLEQGTAVELEQTDQGLLIKPVRPSRRPSLQSLLTQCKGRNPHADVDFGEPAGSEVW